MACVIFAIMFKVRIAYILLLTILFSCSDYNKLLKTKDLDEKYEGAVKYYKGEKYTKAQPLFEELITLLKLTEQGEKSYYYYAMTFYKLEQFQLSSYYFQNFARLYPQSEFTEEAYYLSAVSNLNLSPSYELDQSETYRAIREFQNYLDLYPNTERKDTCNKIIDGLLQKLEDKDYHSAKLYYKIQRYKAAQEALDNFIAEYPGSKYIEEATYLQVLANYQLALNSVKEKKLERYQKTVGAYNAFDNQFPGSKYVQELARIKQLSERQIVVHKEYDKYNKIVTFYERGKKAKKGKKEYFDKAISNYKEFVKEYPKSRYLRELKRINEQCHNQIKKIS